MPNSSRHTPAVFEAAAVLFDNDGVLVDSRATGEKAWTAWARQRSLDPEAVLAVMHGQRSRDTVAQFIPPEDLEEATAEIDLLEMRAATDTSPIPGAAALIQQIPDASRVLVTSASRPLGSARLDAAGVPSFATMVTAEMVTEGKPSPEPYETAARLLGLATSDCIVVEDSSNGIRAARAAKVGAVIGIGTPAVGQGCDIVVPDCTHLSWTAAGLVASDPICLAHS